MAVFQFCTPEWLEKLQKTYNSDPGNERFFKGVTASLCYKVLAEPEGGIEEDIIFGHEVFEGKLLWSKFVTEEEAKKCTFVFSAPPNTWKKLLRKEGEFMIEMVLGDLRQEHGDKSALIGLLPYVDPLLEFMAKVELQFPDEMSPDELERYKTHMKEFREKLGV